MLRMAGAALLTQINGPRCGSARSAVHQRRMAVTARVTFSPQLISVKHALALQRTLAPVLNASGETT
jgi:hypothetical protein